ncbi:YmfQ family protein [Salmonella enterica subsp. enterica serovar Hermannswerder]|nr:DUF2313 domain-containing protein [Salmonella enterica subsp. enterica serovar Richmond]EBX7267828.1 phage tail protein [Salmonella enterica subsp. enterica serovar Abony]ECK0367427.1 DUF2313 domain-containing protein [Salmonella enterica subsp. enterica serovar Abony]EEC0646350.1 YmfQ family protein [Salmonella enterica subsp. enterica]EGI6166559.1 YmfQ family protein [Salmonella enterica subsp. enterica serovar Hermannswerder]
MTYATLLGQLLPPVSYDPNAPLLGAELHAEGAQFTCVEQSADRVSGGITPLFAQALLADWERVTGLSPGEHDTYQQRLAAVLAKLAETGGLSRAYFIRLAANLGYTITIEEPDVFRAGVNRAGDSINSPDVIWVWRVNVFSSKIQNYRFRAGCSAAGERLSYFADTVIESVFNDLKPAHTFCYFTYQEI